MQILTPDKRLLRQKLRLWRECRAIDVTQRKGWMDGWIEHGSSVPPFYLSFPLALPLISALDIESELIGGSEGAKAKGARVTHCRRF